MPKSCAIIGSRETPVCLRNFFFMLGVRVAQMKWEYRSGAALGPDSWSGGGYLSVTSKGCFIFLPENGFQGHTDAEPGYIDATTLSAYGAARDLAAKVHPNWKRCSDYARKTHTRNGFQVLGEDLDYPADFIFLWAKPKGSKGEVQGGSGQAVRLANMFGCNTVNFYDVSNIHKAIKLFKLPKDIVDFDVLQKHLDSILPKRKRTKGNTKNDSTTNKRKTRRTKSANKASCQSLLQS